MLWHVHLQPQQLHRLRRRVAPQIVPPALQLPRRDQEGNVVDVQKKSQSGTAPAEPDAPEPEVRDPFN